MSTISWTFAFLRFARDLNWMSWTYSCRQFNGRIHWKVVKVKVKNRYYIEKLMTRRMMNRGTMFTMLHWQTVYSKKHSYFRKPEIKKSKKRREKIKNKSNEQHKKPKNTKKQSLPFLFVTHSLPVDRTFFIQKWKPHNICLFFSKVFPYLKWAYVLSRSR